MFDLNPYHLQNASLLHFLMLQGTALLGYLIFGRYYEQRLRNLMTTRRLLQDDTEIIRRLREKHEMEAGEVNRALLRTLAALEMPAAA